MQGKTLGRLACLIAGHLRGSNLPTYSPSVDMGGYVVVINAEKVTVTGNKASQKLYRRHTTGRPGSMKVRARAANVSPRAPLAACGSGGPPSYGTRRGLGGDASQGLMLAYCGFCGFCVRGGRTRELVQVGESSRSRRPPMAHKAPLRWAGAGRWSR